MLLLGIIPYKINEHTKYVFPLKFFEFMAAGLSIVSTNLQSLQSFSDYYRVAESRDVFAKLLLQEKELLVSNKIDDIKIDR